MIQAMQEQTAALVEVLRQPSAPVDYAALAAAIAQAIAPLMRTPERVIERVEVVEKAVSQPVVPLVPDGTREEIELIPRLKSAADTVREFLENNPEARSWTVRDIEKETGVGKSTVQRVLSKMKG